MRKYRLPVWMTLLVFLLPVGGHAQQDTSVDICVYGGTSAGVIAACSAMRLGNPALLIEPGGQVGGMTTGGLGETDIGNKGAITGLARDFYRRVGARYGEVESWTFEPHVALSVFLDYIRAEGLPVWYHYRLSRVEKKGTAIEAIILERADPGTGPRFCRVRAKVFM